MGWTRGKARTPTAAGEFVSIHGHRGKVVEKKIRCGHTSGGEPKYRLYKYLVIREGKRVKTIYLGKA